MKIPFSAVAVLSFLAAASVASAQDIEINRENRTIAVSASGTVEVEPEIAIISLGYHNHGRTQDAAYEDNTRAASKIIDALLAAGLKKANIETQDMRLHQVDSRDADITPQERKERQFEAEQDWNIRVPPAEAQNVVDRAVAAGANEMGGVVWAVADAAALDAKAGTIALAKARGLADQMAQEYGGKVGKLLFVSNTQPGTVDWFGNRGSQQFVMVEATRTPSLKLFPQKVRHELTVYVVFALE